MKLWQDIVSRVALERMANDLWRLVSIPSPTGRERRIAHVFAEMLSRAGAAVEMDTTLSNSPCVIGRLKGNRPGRTFQLAGHLDHIDIPHAAPARTDKVISGRGAADMKNGLAGILETVRVLRETGCDFPGEVLVTAYGLHEAPAGHSEGLLYLIKSGIKGDAALVAEGDIRNGRAIITGKGQSIWDLAITRKGAVCHELNRPKEADGLLSYALAMAGKLREHDRTLAGRHRPYPLLTPESLFVGQLHYGDFYNRVPLACFLQGTRRWHPYRTFSAVKHELDALLKKIRRPSGTQVKTAWTFVGESYAVDRNEPVVRSLADAYRSTTGKQLNYTGTSLIFDSHRLAPLGKVPTVLVGFGNRTAHADHEFAPLGSMREAGRIVLLTVLNYLYTASKH
jgi:acetylornithine deacetylase/succinyl-diaminopimelate desuccinylase-like protein